IYVGMGESTIRGNVSHGDGVYKSTDAGKTWSHLGLAETRNIGKVRVHPRNPDLVYVAAFGHAHGPNPDRGVYRSRDGGATWEHVLFRGEKAGAIDLAMDPNNPRILYASLWEAHRGPYQLVSGGEGSGLFRSTDGGDTLKEISRNKGLPEGVLGKIGVSVSGARPDRVWALVEAENGAVFRSDDGGDNWERLSEDRNLRQRAWYYHHIFADPQDAETVWVLNVEAWKSTDGGKTFNTVSVPHGDNHDLWIDPRDPLRIIEGNDGGACVSFNGGDTWSDIYSQPTAEFYHVTTDTRVPYRLYGAQQDNTTISVPSRSKLSGITRMDWDEIGGGESGYIAVRPDDPNIVFSGSYQGYLTRYDARTGQQRIIDVWPLVLSGWAAKEARYRFQWTYPIMLSPHDPNMLYVTGNHVFRSADEGSSWEEISPDLTRNDESTLGASGGPITKDNTGAEYYGTIFAFAESPKERGLFWAGSDDGRVHVSRDNAASWQDVTPNELPKWALVSIIEPSPHDAATAYLAATCYKSDDFHPYLFKTNDYGKTWTAITNGLHATDFTRAIREDPQRRGLLFAGTETGVHVSFDDGGHWQPLQMNLPVVPIHDLVIKDNDLVLATHGRAFWILDDMTQLRQLDAANARGKTLLFKPMTATRFQTSGGFTVEGSGKNYDMTGPLMNIVRPVTKPTGEKSPKFLTAGQNPPDGVIVAFYLPEKPAGDIKLTFLDANDDDIKSFTSEEKKDAATTTSTAATLPPTEHGDKEDEKKEPRVPKEAGGNRFVWDMRYPETTRAKGYTASEGAMKGPLANPGLYKVRLTVGDQSFTESFEIVKDPRVSASAEDLTAQFELLMRIRGKLDETYVAINELRDIRSQAEDWEKRAKDAKDAEKFAGVAKAAADLKEKLTGIEEKLIQAKAKGRQDVLNFPVRLNAHLAYLGATVASADYRPSKQAYEAFEDISTKIDEELARYRDILERDVAAFSSAVREAEVPPIVARAPKKDK
ncbi:MAG: glycosyl hydrolase, partial [Ktedonobacterales bacterium]